MLKKRAAYHCNVPAKPLPSSDLEHILEHAHDALLELKGARLFITGGTGFFGHWLLESLLFANRVLHLDASAVVLTRNAARFREGSPHIAGDPAITLLEGDTATFNFPSTRCTHIIHAATDSTGGQASFSEEQLAASIVSGTQHVLDFAHSIGAQRLLYVSSGAVYGRGITSVARIAENFPFPPMISPPRNYDQAKLVASAMCLAEGFETSMAVAVAQCFAFVGPRLPLDQHFAIGNFIADALAGRPIHIKGDGTPLRSFLYMADLAVWLWTLLTRAPRVCGYNVGSDESVSIAELAHLVADTLRPGLPVQIDGTPDPTRSPQTYVPDIDRARTELGLRVTIPLREAIRRTAAWHLGQSI